jgi:hypothetical protein
MRDRLLSVDDPAAVVRYLLAHFLFRGRWDDGFGTHLVGMAQAGLVPPLGGTGFTRLWSGCTNLRSVMLYVDPDLTPISSGPGSGQRFRAVLSEGKLKKVWRFLQRIVSNGLALKTAILRGDELKEFPHACKPETKNPTALRACKC